MNINTLFETHKELIKKVEEKKRRMEGRKEGKRRWRKKRIRR